MNLSIQNVIISRKTYYIFHVHFYPYCVLFIKWCLMLSCSINLKDSWHWKCNSRSLIIRWPAYWFVVYNLHTYTTKTNICYCTVLFIYLLHPKTKQSQVFITRKQKTFQLKHGSYFGGCLEATDEIARMSQVRKQNTWNGKNRNIKKQYWEVTSKPRVTTVLQWQIELWPSAKFVGSEA